MNLLHQWMRGLPAEQRDAVLSAFENASLAKARRALRLLRDAADAQPALHVELLGTFSLEPLLPFVELALECLPSRAKVAVGPLDNIEAHVSQPSARTTDGASARVIFWRVEEVLPELLHPFTHGFPDVIEERIAQTLERVERVAAIHQRHGAGVPLFLSTLALPAHLSQPIFAAQHQSGAMGAIARVNQRIHELASRGEGVHVLDLASWSASEGRQNADPMLDFLARQPFSAKGQGSFALFLARTLRPLIVPQRKVLAVDLDNTLWGGVVGEDGVEGLKLGHDFPGNVHLRIQRELLELRNRGVLLVLLSKNNEADAREAFESLPDMLLKWDDFAVRKVDWNHKHENLRAAARELSLGLDSFAFVDDADYEREQVRQLMPEVLVLNDSADPLHILRALWETDAFDSLTISEEDRRRHHEYAVREARKVEPHGDDLASFLQSLEMEATIEEVGPANLDRVVTMLGKTNQFNVTTRRHSRPQVQSMIDTPGAIALALRLRDKFGDQGIIAVVIGVPSDARDTLRVDSFLVSCRALGRGVEDALWAELLRRADEQGIRRIEAEFIPTAKNGLAAKLYDRLGLECVQSSPEGAQYRAEPLPHFAFPGWISRHKPAHERA